MSINYCVIDYESYYCTKSGYTLKKMTPVEYILDPRFECTGAAIFESETGLMQWLDGEPLKDYFRGKRAAQLRGEKFVMISHNALFDACITAWKYGVVPDLMIDTMGMARALTQARVGYVSLAKTAAHLGFHAKGDTILRVDGMTGQMVRDAGLWKAYTDYAINDAVLCWQIFQALRKDFPPHELLVMDSIIRCAVVPRFRLDRELLHTHLFEVQQSKETLLARCGLPDRTALMSNDKFAEALKLLGVDPPMKTSLTTGKQTYAFAKADHEFAALEEHEDPEVQTLVAARLGFKSTMEETRTQRLIDISNLTWGGKDLGFIPIPLRYAGAHTHRLSGDWSINMQNLKRGGTLRRALKAPPGHVVLTCDAAQIEARIVAWLAGCMELVNAFANGEDVYSLFAGTHVYHRPVSKATPLERFVGKQAVLGLGFGMGWPRYQTQIRKDSRLQLREELILTDAEAQTIVNGYRNGYPEIPLAWKTLGQLIPRMARGETGMTFGPMTFHKDYVEGPTGLRLFYYDLQQRPSDKGQEWVFKSGRMTKRLFGGKWMENFVQHLARCCNMDTALLMRKHYPQFPLAHQVHDELIYVVPGTLELELTPAGKEVWHPRGPVAEVRDSLLRFMATPPTWAAGLPLAAEAGVGLSYGEAK